MKSFVKALHGFFLALLHTRKANYTYIPPICRTIYRQDNAHRDHTFSPKYTQPTQFKLSTTLSLTFVPPQSKPRMEWNVQANICILPQPGAVWQKNN